MVGGAELGGAGVGDEPARAPRRDVARNRERILVAADDLVRERGLDLSFNELAHRAGVGVGTVYRHFSDRDAVVQAMTEGRLERIEAVFADAARIEDPERAFRTALVRICELQAQDRGISQALSSERSPQRQAVINARLGPSMATLVERCRAAGRLREDVTATDIPVILRLMATVTGLTENPADELWRRYLDLVLDGLSTPRPTPLTTPALSPDELAHALARVG